MKCRCWLVWTLPLILTGGFLVSCRTVPAVDDSARPFEQALVAVEGIPNVAPGSKAEAEGIARLKTLLGNLTRETIQDLTAKTYAKNAYLNDTLKTLRGSAAIEDYFLATAMNAEKVTATFQSVQRGEDGLYTFRWTMETRLKKVAAGRTLRTLGITVVRFDDEGRVLVHQDYWDSAQGLFDHIPVVGYGTRAIKGRL
jgi:hypothetical protein